MSNYIKLLSGVLTILFLVMICGCDSVSTKFSKDKPPIIAYWDHGIHNIIKPHLLMAIWSDGTIIWQENLNDRMGIISNSVVNELLEYIHNAGFFQRHFKYGSNDVLLSADERARSLTIYDGSMYKTSIYNEMGIPDYLGMRSSPTRDEVERFHSMWTNIVSRILELRPIISKPVKYNAGKWYPH